MTKTKFNGRVCVKISFLLDSSILAVWVLISSFFGAGKIRCKQFFLLKDELLVVH